MTDHLRDPLAPLRFSLPALLRNVALLPRDLQQKRFSFVQELQTLLGQVNVAARCLQQKDGDGEDRHADSQYGTDTNINQRRAQPFHLPPNAAISESRVPTFECIKVYKAQNRKRLHLESLLRDCSARV